jgi:RimJ/RimL family protein N-acetyltransferase/glycosyltransferase involved in cell wall biosynthesis
MYNRISLRALTGDHASISYKWRNDPDIWRYTGHRPDKIVTYEIEFEWIQKVLKSNNEKRFAICIKQTGQYIGNVQLTSINGYDAALHIFIGEKEFWGQGYGFEATKLVLEYGFEVLQLQSIYLDVKKEHSVAIKMYKKAGFSDIFEYEEFCRMAIFKTDKDLKKVSVFVMSYNHEKYIAEALEGILNQKVDFDFDIVLGDDFSKDATREIILDYAIKYPGKFKLLFYPKNISAVVNQIWVFKNCSGKYIAICEGDDYWTDEYKLQKQVDFLEANNEYTMCFTGYKIKNELKNEETVIDSQYGAITIEDVIKENLFSTATAMFVSKYFNPQIEWFHKMSFGDWTLYLVILFQSKKKAYCLQDITSVYRIHGGGIHGNLHASNLQLIKAYKMHIDFYKNIKKYLFKGQYSALIRQ